MDSSIEKTRVRRVRIFANVFWFIDGLTAINGGGDLERSCKEIYPPELELKKENTDYSQGSFLDLGIKLSIKNFIFNFMIKQTISHV